MGRTLRKTEEIMKQESEAKAKGETFMPDSALGMLQDYAVNGVVLTFVLRQIGPDQVSLQIAYTDICSRVMDSSLGT